ncbi:hypothetical protein H4R34_000322 [Dimargaris verticillata]|uniref:Uncharacterized protein n=1 Tax=Dimargaris verticillata TaxID=2761393 RepID=A0A9W8B5J1_9FUNG|nr:hypothetical protein H4R34_000322 [Dimargaris verticillata]
MGLLATSLVQADTVLTPDQLSVPRRSYATLLETHIHTYVTVVTRTLAEPSRPTASLTSPPALLPVWLDSGWVWLPKVMGQLLYWLCTLVWAGCYGVGYWAVTTLVWTPLVWIIDILLSYGPLLAFVTCTALAGIVLGGMVAWCSARIAPVHPPAPLSFPLPHADKDTKAEPAFVNDARSMASSTTATSPPATPPRAAKYAHTSSPPPIAQGSPTAVPLSGLKRRIVTKHYHSARNHSLPSDSA